jgi:hypothetical protein
MHLLGTSVNRREARGPRCKELRSSGEVWVKAGCGKGVLWGLASKAVPQSAL